MLAAGALQAGGSVLGGINANQQGKYEAAVARNNAKMSVDAARQSEEIGHNEARDYWRQVSQTKGDQVAALAANGIDVGFGTAVRMQEDTKMLSREDAANLYRNINERTKGSLIQASNYRSEAKAAKAKGKAAMIQGIIGGATSLLGAASQFKGMKTKVA